MLGRAQGYGEERALMSFQAAYDKMKYLMSNNLLRMESFRARSVVNDVDVNINVISAGPHDDGGNVPTLRLIKTFGQLQNCVFAGA